MAAPEDLTGPAHGRRPRRPRRRPPANPQAQMSLMEHLRELRNRIGKAALFITIGSVAGWFLYPHIWHFIEGPYCKLPVSRTSLALLGPQARGGRSCSHTLFVTGIFDAFFLRIKVAVIAGVIMASPLWFYQLWAFIAPGLYKRERRWAYLFGASAVPLFAIGSVVAYFAMTKGLRFLLSEVPHGVFPLITIDSYLSYAVAMLAIFGLAFELPLVFMLLNLARVLTHQRFRKWRRMIIFLVFAFAAVFTPSPDPISMLLLAVPCVILVELAEVFIYVHDRRLARGGVVYPGLSPEDQAMLDGVPAHEPSEVTAAWPADEAPPG